MSVQTRAMVAAAEHQFLVRLLNGRTACFLLPAAASVHDLQAYIEQSYGIPASLQRLLCNGTPLDAAHCDDDCDELLSTALPSLSLHSHGSLTSLTVLLSLRGGKGGFGSLLRATTARVGVKRTSDFSAMRDLHGRRMRHVEQDKALQHWDDDMAGKTDEEKKQLRLELRNKMARVKRGQRAEARKPCRWGAQCKYKYKCRGSHPDEQEAEGKAAGGPAAGWGTAAAASWQAAVVDEEEIMDDLRAAMTRRAHDDEKGQKDGVDDEDDAEEEEEESEAEQLDDEEKEQSNSSRRRVWDDELLLDDEDGEDEDEQEERIQQRKDSFSEEKEEKEHWTERRRSGRVATQDKGEQKQRKHEDGRRKHDGDSWKAEEKEERKEVPTDERETRDRQNSAVLTAVLSQPTSFSALAANTSTSVSPPSYPAIDLSQHTTAASVQVYGLEHLRAELDRVGLKCGGTLAERAQRLFMLKDHTSQQLPKKLLKR